MSHGKGEGYHAQERAYRMQGVLTREGAAKRTQRTIETRAVKNLERVFNDLSGSKPVASYRGMRRFFTKDLGVLHTQQIGCSPSIRTVFSRRKGR